MALIQHPRWMKVPSPPPAGTLGTGAAQAAFGGKAAAGSTWVQVPGTAGMPAGSLQPGSHQLLWALLPRSSRQHGEQTERSHPRASQTQLLLMLRVSALSSAPPARPEPPFTRE